MDITPTSTRAEAHFFMRTSQHFSSNVGTPHWLKVKGICVAHFSALISTLLDGPLGRFPPCCCLANPTPNSGCEPNFYSYMNEDHVTEVSSAVTIQKVSRVQEHPAAASKPQRVG